MIWETPLIYSRVSDHICLWPSKMSRICVRNSSSPMLEMLTISRPKIISCCCLVIDEGITQEDDRIYGGCSGRIEQIIRGMQGLLVVWLSSGFFDGIWFASGYVYEGPLGVGKPRVNLPV